MTFGPARNRPDLSNDPFLQPDDSRDTRQDWLPERRARGPPVRRRATASLPALSRVALRAIVGAFRRSPGGLFRGRRRRAASAAQVTGVVAAVRGKGQAALGSSLVADATRHAPRVDPCNPNELALLQPVVQKGLSSPVGGSRDVLAQHQSTARGTAGFDVLVVRPHVSDVREGEGDDLPRVGGIRDSPSSRC
jgi:hypothetical protein